MTRGIRNNNPLNIRFNRRNDWQGKLANVMKTDKEFEEFVSMEYGFRAAIKLVNNYIRRGYDTPRFIISRWAPPTENDTEGYISKVCAATGFQTNQRLTIGTYNVAALLWAMAIIESGREIYDYQEVFKRAWEKYQRV